MKYMFLFCVFLSIASASDSLSKHSISLSIVPAEYIVLFPDLSYEYSIDETNSIGISSVIAVFNRFTYTKKMSLFCLTGSLGFFTPTFDDDDEFVTILGLTGEYRQPFGENFFSRVIGGGFFSGETLLPIVQLGIGYRF